MRTFPLFPVVLISTAALLLSGCATGEVTEEGLLPLSKSPDDIQLLWDLNDAETLEGDVGVWVRGENGYENEELGCTVTPSLLASPPEMTGSDKDETANLLAGVSAEVTSWVDGATLQVPITGGDMSVEVATATYVTGEDEQNSVFLAARYFAQTGQIVMAIISCETPEGYEFATTPGGIADAGFNLVEGVPTQ